LLAVATLRWVLVSIASTDAIRVLGIVGLFQVVRTAGSE
jgi:hypothetical protein